MDGRSEAIAEFVQLFFFFGDRAKKFSVLKFRYIRIFLSYFRFVLSNLL